MKKILLLLFKHEDLKLEAQRLRYVCKTVVSPSLTSLSSIIENYAPHLIAIDDTCPREVLENISLFIPPKKTKEIIICKFGKNDEDFPGIQSKTYLREVEDLLK